jgi:hypothetical protein
MEVIVEYVRRKDIKSRNNASARSAKLRQKMAQAEVKTFTSNFRGLNSHLLAPSVIPALCAPLRAAYSFPKARRFQLRAY